MVVVRSSRPAETRRIGALLLAAVLVASQAAAWLHAAEVTHVTCVEHGEAVHAAARAASEEAREAPVRAAATVVAGDELATVAAHEHCASGALLRWRALAISAPSTAIFLPHVVGVQPGPAGLRAAPTAAVYRLAPKTSPPHATV